MDNEMATHKDPISTRSLSSLFWYSTKCYLWVPELISLYLNAYQVTDYLSPRISPSVSWTMLVYNKATNDRKPRSVCGTTLHLLVRTVIPCCLSISEAHCKGQLDWEWESRSVSWVLVSSCCVLCPQPSYQSALVILLVRTYAIYNRSRRVLYTLGPLWMVCILF